MRPVRGESEGGITCVVTALLKVTRRRSAARFRARFRAFFLDPGIQPLPVPDPALTAVLRVPPLRCCYRCTPARATPSRSATPTANRGSRRLMVSRCGPHV